MVSPETGHAAFCIHLLTALPVVIYANLLLTLSNICFRNDFQVHILSRFFPMLDSWIYLC